jgi:hypothetical protein
MIAVPEAELLYRLAAAVTDGCIVEVGAFRGRSTIALSLGSRSGANAAVFAIEPHEEYRGVLGGRFGPDDRAAFYRGMLRSGRYENVRLVNLSSEVVTPGWRRPVGLLWIDGDHSPEGVARDFDCWRPHLAPGARVAFDDSAAEGRGPTVFVRSLVDRGAAEVVETAGGITVLTLTEVG